MNTRVQRWEDFARFILILDADATAILDIHEKPNHFGLKAEFYSLYVGGLNREEGWGDVLLAEAERIAKHFGENELWLYWDENHTPEWVFDWYKRKGYVERGVTVDNKHFMSKTLNRPNKIEQ